MHLIRRAHDRVDKAQLRMAPYDRFRPPPFSCCFLHLFYLCFWNIGFDCLDRLFLLFCVETIGVVRVHSPSSFLISPTPHHIRHKCNNASPVITLCGFCSRCYPPSTLRAVLVFPRRRFLLPPHMHPDTSRLCLLRPWNMQHCLVALRPTPSDIQELPNKIDIRVIDILPNRMVFG